jgi:hypothetical protein
MIHGKDWLQNLFSTEMQQLQASLPIYAGGLGIRQVALLAPLALLASAIGTQDLQYPIFCQTNRTIDDAWDYCSESQLCKSLTLPPFESVTGRQ